MTIALLLLRLRSDWPAVPRVSHRQGNGECLDHNPVGLEIWLRFFSVIEVLTSKWLLPSFTTLDRPGRSSYTPTVRIRVGLSQCDMGMCGVFFHREVAF